MKNQKKQWIVNKIIVVAYTLFFAVGAFGQTYNQMTLKNSHGKKIRVDEVLSHTKPVLLIFWKMTDLQSRNNLKETIQVVSDSIGLEKIELIAVCGGETGSLAMAEPWLNSQELDIDFYYDVNDELCRQMGIEAPFTMVMHPTLKMVFKNCGYSFGNEAIICSVLKDCLSHAGD